MENQNRFDEDHLFRDQKGFEKANEERRKRELQEMLEEPKKRVLSKELEEMLHTPEDNSLEDPPKQYVREVNPSNHGFAGQSILVFSLLLLSMIGVILFFVIR